jgi:hypothetical protein
MKIAGFLVIGFFAIMAIAVGFVYFGENTESLNAPQISDNISPSESVQINPNPADDTIDITESVDVEIDDASYTIDEDGKKRYTIDVRDSPVIQD